MTLNESDCEANGCIRLASEYDGEEMEYDGGEEVENEAVRRMKRARLFAEDKELLAIIEASIIYFYGISVFCLRYARGGEADLRGGYGLALSLSRSLSLSR